ncbi:MAG: iron ABC transporter permease [Candidatus Thiodiazotropha lotti]|uniref:ABC transporter permease n=1 Tax=Candidatus Thiodiazotropha endoloripes TaxID=1818881 RepID=A0A1E2UMV3_9GAMM|nr:iron ABC transporter permease [Candidatus Thiodiazotropha endoloripes]MCG7899288.1 iron ABC transporter permease [Candidatus Thiodiazotropha weberae]MCG7991639.1 iron ABC transporter permease [Candidatus Thiodiazotropha lotti]MCG7904642.1 iron ABC transporter permease [Candidatus Thiodiazotropha weberae]MCG7914143.1 iron ABC transporter permease [Candidatus Thiodiazotropha weberae]MCG7999663.1 iron ABC transporter permease [Candidatus Thiodiazotropha lotti]
MVNLQQQRLILILCLLLACAALLSLLTGSASLPLYEALQQSFSEAEGVYGIILTELRLPRTLVAILAGASLGLSGAVMQSLLRNPLASPGLVGSASGAALGAVVSLYFGLSAVFTLALPLGGIGGALLATLTAYLLAGREAGPLTLILAGVAVNAFALALVSLLLNLAPSPYAVQEIALWMLGSLANISRNELWVMLPGTLIGWLLIWRQGHDLDLLTLGEETAESMGVELAKLRWRLFIAVGLIVGSAISVTGSIGFIGLMIPHILRPLVGYQPSRLLIPSALGGALLLLMADIGVRTIPLDTEIKVGVITSLLGAPFFLWLILKQRRSGT